MLSFLRPALVLTLAFTALTGVAYPLAITGVGQAVLPGQANGSRVEEGGVLIGSSLIGQAFSRPDYFWTRPSATADHPYNASASSGSNYGPTDARLVARVAEAVKTSGAATLPADAVTTSASGLDPDISPQNARSQVARVARARGVEPVRVEDLVQRMTEAPLLGIFGEARVNVLALNLALDREVPLAK